MKSHGGLRRRLWELLLLVGFAALMIGFGFALRQLQSTARHSHERVTTAQSIVNVIRSIDGLEWRAVAGEDPATIHNGVDAAGRQLERLLSGSDEDAEGQRLAAAAEDYLSAVDDMMVALERGDHATALELDRTLVDPGFERAIDLATSIVNDETDAATSTESRVRLFTMALLASLVVVVAASIVLLKRSRRRRQAALTRAAARFSALVEGSQDVFTMVGDDDELTLLSPTWGFLEPLVVERTEVRASDLIAAEHCARWQAADSMVRETGVHDELEVVLAVQDDTTFFVKLHGSLLDRDESTRVWVWRDVTKPKVLEHQLRHEALHDPLTGVANRNLLRDRIQKAHAATPGSGHRITLLFLDIDNFKSINDSVGHTLGDELLRVVAGRIASCVRDCDTVARLGGDEFAVLLCDHDIDKARVLCHRIFDAVGQEASIGGRIVNPSVSIGIADCSTTSDAEQLLRNADLAMYEAKRAGKRQVAVFHNRLHDTAANVLDLQTDLAAAIDRNQLRVHYQPTIRLSDGRVDGVEALARWEHPTLGFIPPTQFIPLAESTGVIVPLGAWVLGEACRHVVALGAATRTPRLRLSVNISPVQLRSPNIVDTIHSALHDSGLPPDLLVLEVTEGALLDNPTAIERLHELRELGLEIAIDDFGTGYTSIAYLQRLPVTVLKIDRCFISGDSLPPQQRRGFLRAIIGLTDALGLRSVAEGIETREQLDEMNALGCDVGQGYFWVRPVPSETLPLAIDQVERFRHLSRS